MRQSLTRETTPSYRLTSRESLRDDLTPAAEHSDEEKGIVAKTDMKVLINEWASSFIADRVPLRIHYLGEEYLSAKGTAAD